MSPAAAEPLVCPGCATPAEATERFCASCGMPLIYAGEAAEPVEATELQERARKVKKQYLEGKLVRVAVGRHQAEAELISGLLLEHGVPSMYKRSAGFDVPDMLFSGPRDVFVPESGAEVARQVLADVEDDHAARGARAAAEAGAPIPSRRASRPTRGLAIVLCSTAVVVSLLPLLLFLERQL